MRGSIWTSSGRESARLGFGTKGTLSRQIRAEDNGDKVLDVQSLEAMRPCKLDQSRVPGSTLCSCSVHFDEMDGARQSQGRTSLFLLRLRLSGLAERKKMERICLGWDVACPLQIDVSLSKAVKEFKRFRLAALHTFFSLFGLLKQWEVIRWLGR